VQLAAGLHDPPWISQQLLDHLAELVQLRTGGH
jgi:hypothetical protein